LRYSRQNGKYMANRQVKGEWRMESGNLFGATIICRRKPFYDVAMQNRTLVIRTKQKSGIYHLSNMPNCEEIVRMLELKNIEISNRVMDTWRPVLSIAHAMGDTEWLEYANKEIEGEVRHLQRNQGIEPSVALIHALSIYYPKGVSKGRIRVRNLKDVLRNEFDLRLSLSQVSDLLQGYSLETVNPQGYPEVKVTAERLDQLRREVETPESGEKTGDK
ncbi:hypothetical protein ACFLU2_03415, partial [Chloroflexota bacterium]